MSQRIVNIGSGPSTGDGDALRNAFDKINQNFTEVYSAINTVQSPVLSVFGRVGNVTLTVNDIIGAVGEGYVDQKILSNIVAAPTTSKGKADDLAGMMSSDGAFFYFCYKNYDGSSDIWAKVPTVGATW